MFSIMRVYRSISNKFCPDLIHFFKDVFCFKKIFLATMYGNLRWYQCGTWKTSAEWNTRVAQVCDDGVA